MNIYKIIYNSKDGKKQGYFIKTRKGLIPINIINQFEEIKNIIEEKEVKLNEITCCIE